MTIEVLRDKKVTFQRLINFFFVLPHTYGGMLCIPTVLLHPRYNACGLTVKRESDKKI